MAKVTKTLKQTRLLYKRIRIALTGQGYCAHFGETAVTWLVDTPECSGVGLIPPAGPKDPPESSAVFSLSARRC